MSRNKKTWDTLVGYDGNYGIDIANGVWPGSGITQKGDEGPKGEPGEKGGRGLRGPSGPKGEIGDEGPDGPTGAKGDSAYTVALDNGFVGDETQWLASLKGETGEKGNLGEKGGFDDLTPEQIESFKGEQGEQGEKGEPSGIFEYKGRLDTKADIDAAPGPHEIGDVYQAADTDDLYVYDGTEFVLLSEALDVVKGQKGEDGQKGQDGLKGDIGDAGEDGEDGEKGDKGEKGEEGLSAYEVAVEEGYTESQPEWVESLKGEKGDLGQKGEDGLSAYELSQQGIDPASQLTEDEWLESLKGQKGENYDPLVLDDYYTKGQTDQVISQLPQPEDSYDRNFMPEANVVSASESIDLNSLDQTHVAFNVGIVLVEAGATVANTPVGAPFIIRNTVVQDITRVRDTDYTVYQEICKIAVDSTQTYSRVAQPAATGFSPWSNSTFIDADYYNKNEVDGLVNGISYSLDQSNSQITLTDKDGSVQTVTLVGINGIEISSTADALVIDGEDLLPTPQFLGLLQDGQDPTAEAAGQEADGTYFIYAYTGVTTGTDPDGAACTPGDWCIYKTDKWMFLDISSDPGVVSVSVGGGLLEVDNSDAANPVVELDPTKVVTPPELEPYLEKNTFIAAAANRKIGDLVDVDVKYTRINFAGSSGYAIMPTNLGDGVTPLGNGERSTDIENNKLFLAKQTSGATDTGLAFFNNINPAADPVQYIRVKDELGDEGAVRVDTVVSKADKGDYFEIEFTNASVPLFSSGWNKNVIFDIVSIDTPNHAVLSYNKTDHTWSAGPLGDYVSKAGDTMSGALLVNAKDATADGEILFAVEGKKTHGGTGDNLFVARREDNDGDQVRYYGPMTYEHEIVTKKLVDSTFLPLSGGTLTSDDLNLPTLMVKGARSDTGAVFGVNPGGLSADSSVSAFRVNGDGSIQAGANAANAFMATEDNHLVTKKKLDDAIANVPSADDKLSLTGGTMTGDITFNGAGSKIVAGTTTNLSGRCSLLLNTAGDIGVGIATESSSKKILSLYGYDGSEDDNRKEVFVFQANGYARFGGKLRLTPESGKAFEVRDVDGNTTFSVNHTGSTEIKPRDASGGTYVFSVYPRGLDDDNGKAAFRVLSNGKVKAGYDSSSPFMATDANDVVTKKYLEDNGGGSGVILHTGSSAPSGEARGTLLLTTDDKFYIYV